MCFANSGKALGSHTFFRNPHYLFNEGFCFVSVSNDIGNLLSMFFVLLVKSPL